MHFSFHTPSANKKFSMKVNTCDLNKCIAVNTACSNDCQQNNSTSCFSPAKDLTVMMHMDVSEIRPMASADEGPLLL